MVLTFSLVLTITYLLILALFNPSSTGKIKKLDFEIPVIPPTLNIYNQRSTSAQPINFSIRASEFSKGYGNAGNGSAE